MIQFLSKRVEKMVLEIARSATSDETAWVKFSKKQLVENICDKVLREIEQEYKEFDRQSREEFYKFDVLSLGPSAVYNHCMRLSAEVTQLKEFLWSIAAEQGRVEFHRQALRNLLKNHVLIMRPCFYKDTVVLEAKRKDVTDE